MYLQRYITQTTGTLLGVVLYSQQLVLTSAGQARNVSAMPDYWLLTWSSKFRYYPLSKEVERIATFFLHQGQFTLPRQKPERAASQQRKSLLLKKKCTQILSIKISVLTQFKKSTFSFILKAERTSISFWGAPSSQYLNL